MPNPTTLPTIGIAGTGLIGASWAANFLAFGHDVRAWDIADGAEVVLRDFVAHAVGDVPGALPADQHGTLSFHTDPADMVAGCALILENGPEREDVKAALLATLDAVAEPQTIIASSTSSLLLSAIAHDCINKDRVIIAHPFNPPHLLALVEMFGTDENVVERARVMFEGVGKRAVVMKKEMAGHIANRLTSALFREALYVLEQGVASAEDIDACITEGPGPRWAMMGPFLGYHMGGGPGGIEHYMRHLGPSQAKRWADHGTPDMSAEFIEHVIDEVKHATSQRTMDQWTAWRDEKLKDVLAIKRRED